MKAPSETQEAITLASYVRSHHPDIVFTHIANEGQQKKVKEGLEPGVCDYFFFEPRGQYHGLAIELKKRDRSNGPSKKQIKFIERISNKNYKCYVAYGWKEAVAQLEEYLS